VVLCAGEPPSRSHEHASKLREMLTDARPVGNAFTPNEGDKEDTPLTARRQHITQAQGSAEEGTMCDACKTYVQFEDLEDHCKQKKHIDSVLCLASASGTASSSLCTTAPAGPIACPVCGIVLRVGSITSIRAHVDSHWAGVQPPAFKPLGSAVNWLTKALAP
jgi:hypothetical protein